MKPMQLLFMSIILGSMFSCQEEESMPTISKEGAWQLDGNKTKIRLDGSPSSLQQIGEHIFGLDASESLAFMEKYVRNHILGPLPLTDAEVIFTNDSLIVQHDANIEQHIYQSLNDGMDLAILDNQDTGIQWLFTVRLSNNMLELKRQIEIEFIDNQNQIHTLEISLSLIRI